MQSKTQLSRYAMQAFHPVDIRHTVLQAPIGKLTLVQSPVGLMMIAFGALKPEAWLERVERSIRQAVRPVRADALPAATELGQYFAGRRRHFRTSLDLRLVSGFHEAVLQELRTVPYGSVVSYSELARRVGRPAAARAVGGAMRSNPIPIILPCHRVTARDGSLGGFSGGLHIKQRLHALEGIKN